MELSVVIVNYNVRNVLEECLSSFYAYVRGISFEVILIDNNSTDGSVQMVKEKFPEVILLQNHTNTGFAAASNSGLIIARGKYILLLNPDTRLKDDSILKMLEFIKPKKANVVVGPRLLNADRSFQHSAFKDRQLLDVFTEAIGLNRLPGFTHSLEGCSSPRRVDALCGAAMLFSAEILKSAGLLDENLHWAEDRDFCLRVRQGGGAIYYFPEASIIHHQGVSAKKNLKIFYSNYHLSRLKYIKKHKHLFQVVLAELLIFFHFLSRIIIFIFLFPFSRSCRNQMRAYIEAFRKNINYIFRFPKPTISSL